MGEWRLVPDKPISEIDGMGGFRKDLGDTDALAESIQRVGLLSPVVISPDNKLVAGGRRIKAVRHLGWDTVPCWVVSEVTDRLTRVLAIRDDDALRKALTPVEQAEAYAELAELEAIYAAQAKANREAALFDSETGAAAGAHSPKSNGVEDSSTPLLKASEVVASRTKAAVDVTGTNSFQRLEQIRELQAIAANVDEDPMVRQDAANALVELNTDGKVAPRWERVKLFQAMTELQNTAIDKREPAPVRKAATTFYNAVRTIENPKEKLRAAKKALKQITDIRAEQPKLAPPPPDPHAKQKQAARSLVVTLRRENGWWSRHDPSVFGQFADDEQWEFFTSYMDQATRFLEAAIEARAAK